MSAPRRSPLGAEAATALGMAAVLGLLADRLLWAGPVGPGLAIWVANLGVAAVFLQRRSGLPGTRGTAAWAAVAVAAAAATALRASPMLHLLLFATMIAAASVLVNQALGLRFGRTRFAAQVLGLIRVPVLAATGAIPLLARVEVPTEGLDRRRAMALGRGLLIAMPPLAVFLALFIAADPVFARLAERVTTFGSEDLPLHLFLVLGFGWIAAGLLRGLLPGPRPRLLRAIRPPRLGVEEIAVVLGLVAVLFTVYVAVQAGYLFGGRAALEAATGLTLAEYARRGFFELVTVAGLVLALLLAAFAASPRGAGRWVFRSLAGVLIGLVLMVIASAALRLWLYHREFGLTVTRFYVASFMVWLTAMLVWFGATVVRGRPRPFAAGALVAGMATTFLLVLANPEALVARTNIGRDHSRGVDVAYLSTLGPDAVPALIAGLDDLPAPERCALATSLLGRAGRSRDDAAADWRVANAARLRADRLLLDPGSPARAIEGSCGASRPTS